MGARYKHWFYLSKSVASKRSIAYNLVMNPIQEIRKASGLSQYELAKALDVTQSTVSQYERGEIRPEISKAIKLVALGKKNGKRFRLEDLYFQKPTKEAEHA